MVFAKCDENPLLSSSDIRDESLNSLEQFLLRNVTIDDLSLIVIKIQVLFANYGDNLLLSSSDMSSWCDIMAICL